MYKILKGVLLAAVPLLLLQQLALAQQPPPPPDATVDASVVIQAPGPSCTAGTPTALYLGTVTRTSSSTAQWVEVDEVDGTVDTSADLAEPTDHAVGHIQIDVENSSSLTVTVTFPSGLDNTAGPGYTNLTYTGAWAVSSTSTSGYTTISGTSDTQSSLSGSVTRHYRFGGRVGDITNSIAADTYDGTIDLSISCSA